MINITENNYIGSGEHSITSIFPMIWFTLNNNTNTLQLIRINDYHKIWNELHQYSLNKTISLDKSINLVDTFKSVNNIDNLQISFIINEKPAIYNLISLIIKNSNYTSCKMPKLIEKCNDNKFGLPIGINFLAINKENTILYTNTNGICDLHLIYPITYVLLDKNEDFNNLKSNIAVKNTIYNNYDLNGNGYNLNTISYFNNLE